MPGQTSTRKHSAHQPLSLRPSMASMVSLLRVTRSTVLRPGQETGTDDGTGVIATTEAILTDTPDESHNGDGGEDMAHVGDARCGDGAGEDKVENHLGTPYISSSLDISYPDEFYS